MKKKRISPKDRLQSLLDAQQAQDPGFTYQSDALWAAFERTHRTPEPLPLRVLSLFGGLLATGLLSSFLATTGLMDSGWGQLLMGLLFLATSLYLDHRLGSLLLDTFSVGLLATGAGLIGTGLAVLTMSVNGVLLAGLLLAKLYVLGRPRPLNTFLAVLQAQACVLGLIIYNKLPELLHLYLALGMSAYLLSCLYEGRALRLLRPFGTHLGAVRAALLCCLLFVLGLLSIGFVRMEIKLPWVWVSSLVCIPLVLWLLWKVLGLLKAPIRTAAWVLPLALIVLLLSWPAPGVGGAAAILLGSFYARYRLGIVLGLLGLAYFLGQYYYDLQFTLLVKSGLLFASGLLLLGGYAVWGRACK